MLVENYLEKLQVIVPPKAIVDPWDRSYKSVSGGELVIVFLDILHLCLFWVLYKIKTPTIYLMFFNTFNYFILIIILVFYKRSFKEDKTLTFVL